MKNYLLVFILVVLSTYSALAQDRMIITYDGSYTSTAASAVLDLYSTTQGFLAPRVALVAVNNSATPVATPADGLLVYNTGTGALTTKGFYYWDASNSLWQRVNAGNGNFVSGTGTENYITKWNNAAGTTIGNSSIFDNGNVGITTAAPAAKFEVNTSSGWNGNVGATAIINGPNSALNGGGLLRINSTTAFGINLGASITLGGTYNGTSSVDFGEIAGRKENNGNGNTAGYLAFSTRPNGGNTAEAMRINSAGNVGVGSVTPGQKLDVAGAVQLGTTATPTTGTIRWNTTTNDFESYDGTRWWSLTGMHERTMMYTGDGF